MDIDGGIVARFDDPKLISDLAFRKATVDQIKNKIFNAGLAGRFSTWPFPEDVLSTFAAIDYAFKWMNGETDGRTDINAMRECLESYTGSGVDIDIYTEDGIAYDNYILYMQPYLTF